MAEEQKIPEKKPEQPKESSEKGFKHIVRIANTDLKGEKAIISALRKIKGVSFSLANALCNTLNIEKMKKTGDLSDSEIMKFNSALKDPEKIGFPVWVFNRRKDNDTGKDLHLLGGDLDFAKGNDIKLLQKMRSRRGLRHAAKLPVRGQRTRSNFRKNKGKVTGVKKKAGAKAGKV